MRRILFACVAGAIAAGAGVVLFYPPPPPEVAPLPSHPVAKEKREGAPDELPAVEPRGLTKGPWLVRPTKTGVTIMFESDAKAEAVLRYGPAGAGGEAAAG